MGEGRIDARGLVGVLDGWAEGAGSLYRLLADAIAAAIERGDLPGGARLPSERALADALPASRGTVVAALGLVSERGLVTRRQGSGTVVRPLRTGRARPELAAGLRAQTLAGRALRASDVPIPLGLSVLDDPETLPARAFDVDAATIRAAGGGHGYSPLGIAPLRDRVADVLTTRGLPTTMEEVAITLGVQHGIAIAADLLRELVSDRPRRVAIEDPTYPGAIDVYSRAGWGFGAVETDRAGADPASVRRSTARDGCPVVHLSPQCASPTGVTTTPARRAELADVLQSSGAWLVEDAALEFLVEDPGGYLAATCPDRALLLGTTSKVFWGGLRVGWMRAPAPMVAQVGGWRAAQDLGSAIGPQVTALRLLDEIDAIGAQRRRTAAARRDHLRDRLAATAPHVGCHRPDGGLSLWVQVPDAALAVRAAAAYGVDVVPGPVCSVTNRCEDRIRISAWAPLDVLDEAAARLGRAWADVAASPRS